MANSDSLPDKQSNSKEGWLLKRGKLSRGWKRRYVVVSSSEMKYGDTPQLTRKTIPLLGCEIKGLVSSSSKAFTFTVKPVKSNRVHHFAADCEEDYQLWLQTMYLARTPDGRTNRTDTSEACVLQ
jgi:hypothetical protein